MNSPHTISALAIIRHEERLREAEHARLVRQLRAGQVGIVRRVCANLLLAMGAKLTRMGQHLRPAQSPQLLGAHAKRH